MRSNSKRTGSSGRAARLLWAGIAVIALAACDDEPQGQNGAGPNASFGNAAGVHTISDPLAPGGSTAAVDVTPPAGWKVESTVRWDNANGQCSTAMASPMFRMTSPDGRASIEQFPGFLVTTSEQDIRRRGSTPGDFCMIGMADSGGALAQRFALPFLRPQSRITGIRDVALDPSIAAMQPRVEQMRAASGMNASLYTVEATLENADGTIEKITLGGMILAGQQMMPGVPPMMLNQNLVGYAVRAPADRMAATEALATGVRASIRPRPDWQAAVDAHRNRMTKPVFAPPGGGGGGSGGSSQASGTGSYGAGGGTPTIGSGVNSDKAQRDRIDGIYEQERCADGRVVSIHTGC
jgi:hypothetical protein